MDTPMPIRVSLLRVVEAGDCVGFEAGKDDAVEFRVEVGFEACKGGIYAAVEFLLEASDGNAVIRLSGRALSEPEQTLGPRKSMKNWSAGRAYNGEWLC